MYSMLYGVAIEKSCALFISSFRRWQTNRLEQRLHAACRRARIFIKIYFDFMSLLLFRFIIIFFLFCFWAFCSRRVQCQKCEAVLFFFFLVFGMRPARAFCQPQKLLAIFRVSCRLRLSLSLSPCLCLSLLTCSCGP